MDAVTFRWVLVIIAVVLALAIYFFGQHQARLRKRNAIEVFDVAFFRGIRRGRKRYRQRPADQRGSDGTPHAAQHAPLSSEQ